MIELQDSFKGRGEVSNYSFKKVVSNNTAYVYEISDDNNNLHYEAFKRKESKKHVSHIAGIDISYEAKVNYPTSNNFGVTARCFKSFESAMIKFDQINNRKHENRN